jgi:cation diffusion facilitator CzcD-associated flavoprotein CzcO
LIFSDRYYPALQRPNVSLITDPIAEITADGILTRDQYLHRLDAIILATGFDGHAYLRPIQVTGVDGITLDSIWQDRPIAYRSVCVPQMPNFFLVVGPNSPVANLSVVKVAEWQCAFILRCLKVARHGRIALSPSRAAIARELEAIDSAAPRTVWGSGCRRWYLDHKGRPNLYTLPPWQYRAALSSGPDLQDFDTFRLLEPD